MMTGEDTKDKRCRTVKHPESSSLGDREETLTGTSRILPPRQSVSALPDWTALILRSAMGGRLALEARRVSRAALGSLRTAWFFAGEQIHVPDWLVAGG